MNEHIHYISVCQNNKTDIAMKVPLDDAMAFLINPENCADTKDGSILLFCGYRDEETYKRWENHMQKCSVIMIDCDNKQCDKDIMQKFKKSMENYDYYLYETFSSSEEQPKFRAVIPLDKEIEWSKYLKTSVFHMFSQYADDKASWFYAPTKNKLDTFTIHSVGNELPTTTLEQYINNLKIMEQIKQTQDSLEQAKYNERKELGWVKERNPSSWRNLPSVKKCLSGLSKGERDSSINAACYAMNKNGYGRNISEFLDEISMTSNLPRDMINKFKQKYR